MSYELVVFDFFEYLFCVNAGFQQSDLNAGDEISFAHFLYPNWFNKHISPPIMIAIKHSGMNHGLYMSSIALLNLPHMHPLVPLSLLRTPQRPQMKSLILIYFSSLRMSFRIFFRGIPFLGTVQEAL